MLIPKPLLFACAVILVGACGGQEGTPSPDAAPGSPAAAPSSAESPTLPEGVASIAFGAVQRGTTATGGQTCSIPVPLPLPPEFEAGVREIAFVLMLDQDLVGPLDVSIAGPVGAGDTQGTACNAYTVADGALRQTQLGSSIVRLDGKPFEAGNYRLEIKSSSGTTKVPFAVK